MPTENNIGCDVVEDYGPKFVVTLDGTKYTAPQDITGWDISFVIHEEQDDGLTLKTYTVAGGGIVIPVGTDGLFQTLIPNADIVSLGVGRFKYYAYRTTVGKRADLSRGDFEIRAV